MLSDKKKAAEIGKKGEEKVADYLKSKGYIILKRNYKDSYGEVDIIAQNEEYIVFVEVKTRSENAIVSGFEAVNSKKQRLIKNEALMFTKRLKTELTPRIDVAEVTVSKSEDGNEKWKLNYLKNAY
ncbi:MAG: YraN family protein [Clostridia bacterium]|nr:YraN family protein [Clostridia bacterium]